MVAARGGVQTADTLAASSDTLAAPTSGASTAQVTGSATPRGSRLPLWIGVLVALGGGIGTFAWMQSRDRGEPTAPAAAGSAPVAPAVVPATVPPDAPVAPDAPVVAKTVIVTITGAPEGAEVKMGSTTVGVTPTLQLERSASPIVLNLFLDGYLPASVTVTPDRDLSADAPMKKKVRTKPGPKPTEHDPNDLADPFKRKKL